MNLEFLLQRYQGFQFTKWFVNFLPHLLYFELFLQILLYLSHFFKSTLNQLMRHNLLEQYFRLDHLFNDCYYIIWSCFIILLIKSQIEGFKEYLGLYFITFAVYQLILVEEDLMEQCILVFYNQDYFLRAIDSRADPIFHLTSPPPFLASCYLYYILFRYFI